MHWFGTNLALPRGILCQMSEWRIPNRHQFGPPKRCIVPNGWMAHTKPAPIWPSQEAYCAEWVNSAYQTGTNLALQRGLLCQMGEWRIPNRHQFGPPKRHIVPNEWIAHTKPAPIWPSKEVYCAKWVNGAYQTGTNLALPRGILCWIGEWHIPNRHQFGHPKRHIVPNG